MKICKGKGGSRDGWECLLRCRAELSPFIYPRLLIRRAIQFPLAVSLVIRHQLGPFILMQPYERNGVGEISFPVAVQKSQVIHDGVREYLLLYSYHSTHLATPPFSHDTNCAPEVCIHMSGVTSRPSRSEQKLATSRDGDTEYRGQRHYRIQHTSTELNPVTMNESNQPEVESVETDISAVQKMLSAVSGSLLTSLLGIFLLPKYIFE